MVEVGGTTFEDDSEARSGSSGCGEIRSPCLNSRIRVLFTSMQTPPNSFSLVYRQLQKNFSRRKLALDDEDMMIWLPQLIFFCFRSVNRISWSYHPS